MGSLGALGFPRLFEEEGEILQRAQGPPPDQTASGPTGLGGAGEGAGEEDTAAWPARGSRHAGPPEDV